MLIGFRAGPDQGIGVRGDDFAGTRRAWGLPDGTAPIGRAFPSNALTTAATSPAQLLARVEAAAAAVIDAGMWPYLSFKPSVKDTLAGALDQHFTELGRWASGVGVPVYFSVWHEPENDPMGAAEGDYLRRAGNFVAVHTRAYRGMKEQAGDALRMGPCHLVYKWAPRSPETQDGPVALAWKVPADARDFLAADSYTSNWSWNTSGAPLRNKKDFQRWLKLIVGDETDQIVLAERGVSANFTAGPRSPEEAQAEVLRDDAAYLRELGAHALLYWNSGGANDDSVYPLGEPGRRVFAEIAAAAVEPKPEPPPVPPAPPPGPDLDRYNEGVAIGRVIGRTETLNELEAWIASKRS